MSEDEEEAIDDALTDLRRSMNTLSSDVGDGVSKAVDDAFDLMETAANLLSGAITPNTTE